jgi:DedD protein
MSTEAQMVCLAALALLSVAVPGVFGNALLYSACRKKIEAALAVNATFADACAMLKRQASNRQRVIGLGIGNAVLLATAAYLAVTFVNLPGLASHPDISTSKALGTITDATSTQAGLSQPQRTVLADPPAMAASATASSPTSVAPPIPMPPASAALAASAPTTASIPVLTSSAQTTSDTPPAAPVFQEKIVETSKAEPAPKPAPKKTSQPKPVKAAPDKASPNSETPYLVNVGLCADENNARNAVAKLNDAGIPVLSSTLDTSKGKRTRVRAGPFDTQAEAQRAADKIIFLGLDAVIARK